MNKADTKYYDWFREVHMGETCWLPSCERTAARAHHVFRRHKGTGRILVALCVRCDSMIAHQYDIPSRPLLAKIACVHHPEIIEDVWAVEPESNLSWLKGR